MSGNLLAMTDKIVLYPDGPCVKCGKDARHSDWCPMFGTQASSMRQSCTCGRTNPTLWARWVLIQVVSLVLAIIGVPLVAWLAYSADIYWEGDKAYWAPQWAWLWSNNEDGIFYPARPYTSWSAFVWSGLRNPVNNLRFVRGVSQPTGPYKLWVWRTWYFHIGYRPTQGWPVLSGGRN